MSNKTDALLLSLHSDLSHHLDPYQLAMMAAGKERWPDITLKQAQSFALGQAFLKKFNEAENPSKEASQAALDKFLRINDSCRSYELVCLDRRDEDLVGGLSSYIESFYFKGGFSLITGFEQIIARGGVGPGASVSARGNDFYTKLFDSPLSVTKSDLLFVWEKTISSVTRWADAFRSCALRWSPKVVAGNKLSFVNKNVTVARCISTEPTINMWYQLGIGRILTDRLASYTGIDLSNQQTINREMAREGSLSQKYVTIDLESASDSLSMTMLAERLPKSLMNWLTLVRSPTVELPNRSRVNLEMMSTMGNGFTFPLQTLVFSAVVQSVYRFMGIRPMGFGPSGSRNFGVFGDDIIVLKEAAPNVLRLLKLIGCTVNQSKSFVEGPFRESCGGDYFDGFHCRGVYCKKLRTLQDFYVTVNGLNRWSAHTGILLPSTMRELFRMMEVVRLKWESDVRSGFLKANKPAPKRQLVTLKWVPSDEADDAGIQVPFDTALGIKSLQFGVVSYHYDAAVAKYLYIGDDAIECGTNEVVRNVNPDGLILSLLTGCIRGCRIALRQRVIRYRTRRRVTPSWDTLSPQSRAEGLEWSRWSNAVRFNILLSRM